MGSIVRKSLVHRPDPARAGGSYSWEQCSRDIVNSGTFTVYPFTKQNSFLHYLMEKLPFEDWAAVAAFASYILHAV